MTRRKKKQPQIEQAGALRKAQILYGKPTSSIRYLIDSVRSPEWRGEPDWLIHIREVADSALNDYYGNHE